MPSEAAILRQRIISVVAISAITFAGLESLVYINNLYQVTAYVQLSVAIYALLVLWLYFLFDLHYKQPFTRGADGAGSLWRALRARFKYFESWKNLRHFQNFLILPGIIYWGAIIIIGINFGHQELQQFVAIASGLALVVAYSLFKEVFHSKMTPIHNRHFVILSYVKMYASWLIYSAALGIVWYYCFPPIVFYAVVFFTTLALLYQALFQFSQMNLESVLLVFGISILLALGSYFVFVYWNVNYFSAGLFLAAINYLLWGMLFHWLNGNLTKEVVFEHIAIFVLIVVLVFGATNFQARIARC